ncbi:hypothetical protein B0H12DRAFT_88353 [Mycena haematopus]|nr:hypothetical protein B0H12DRAFT_88353 [Mycena haematopus]
MHISRRTSASAWGQREKSTPPRKASGVAQAARVAVTGVDTRVLRQAPPNAASQAERSPPSCESLGSAPLRASCSPTERLRSACATHATGARYSLSRPSARIASPSTSPPTSSHSQIPCSTRPAPLFAASKAAAISASSCVAVAVVLLAELDDCERARCVCGED